MQIKNKQIKKLVSTTEISVIPFSYIKRNQKQFPITPQTWEICQQCNVRRQGRFMYWIAFSATLCRECTTAHLIVGKMDLNQVTVKDETPIEDVVVEPAKINYLLDIIDNSLVWISNQFDVDRYGCEIINSKTQQRLNDLILLNQIGVNVLPAIPLLLKDQLPERSKDVLRGVLVPLINLAHYKPVNQTNVIIFDKTSDVF